MRTLSLIESNFSEILNSIDYEKEEQTILTLLRTITFPEFLNILNTIKSDFNLLSKVANLSYSHPNGFDKIVLINNQLFGLRLHVWWQLKGFIESNNDIHNHRWNFATRLIKGTYNSEIYQSSDNNVTYNYFIYHHEAKNVSLEKQNVSGLELVSSQVVNENESYSQSFNILHRINTFSTPIMTLFLHGHKVVSQTDVFRQQSGIEYEPVNSISYLTPQDLATTLNMVCKYLCPQN